MIFYWNSSQPSEFDLYKKKRKYINNDKKYIIRNKYKIYIKISIKKMWIKNFVFYQLYSIFSK